MFEKLKEWVWPKNEPKAEKNETPSPTPETVAKPKKPRKKKEKETVSNLSAKEKATLAGEPYVAILRVDIDPNDINNGSFELDWNDKFVINLIKQGYKIRPDDTDNQIVDRWFQTVCRNIALEVYEQEAADPDKRVDSDLRIIQQRDLGGGFTEVS